MFASAFVSATSSIRDTRRAIELMSFELNQQTLLSWREGYLDCSSIMKQEPRQWCLEHTSTLPCWLRSGQRS